MKQWVVSIVITICIGGIFSGAAYLFARFAVEQSNQSWCPALNIIISKPVPKPTDPNANPSREHLYNDYQVFLAQDERFGCNGNPRPNSS